MSTLTEIKKNLGDQKSSVITVGNFDGVHIGHLSIFKKIMEIAQKEKLAPIVFILFPHPKVLFTGSSPALLSNFEDRKKIIQDFGIKNVVDLTFDQSLSEMSASSFLHAFKKEFELKHLVIGSTTHIGKNREGTPQNIVHLAEKIGFQVSVLSQLEKNGCKVSSSIIREIVSKGEVKQATAMLGRYYSSRGVVVTGMGKGRTIGFPTANLSSIETMIPCQGVYAGYAILGQKKYKAAINIGTRPTLTSDKKLVVECHLIDFEGKIVGESLEIQWVERLRNESKFESVDQLKNQIQADVGMAKIILK